MLKYTKFIALLAAAIALSGCNSSNNTPVNNAQSLEARIATTMTETTGDMWLCGIDNTVIAAHLFLPAGQIAGLNPEHRMGMEIDHTKPSMADQTRYMWSVIDDGSLMMDSLSHLEPVMWSSIIFIEDDHIQVVSSTRGPLDCYRGTGALPTGDAS